MTMALEVFIHVVESLVSVDIRFEVVSALLSSVFQFRHFGVSFCSHVIRIIRAEKVVVKSLISGPSVAFALERLHISVVVTCIENGGELIPHLPIVLFVIGRHGGVHASRRSV